MRKKAILLCSIFTALLMLATTAIAEPLQEQNIIEKININPLNIDKENKSNEEINENKIVSQLKFKKLTFNDNLEKEDMPDCNPIEFLIGFFAFLAIACGMDLFAMFLLAHTLLPGVDIENVRAVMYYLLDLISD